MSDEYLTGLVTVIIPVYNLEKYVEKCIRSVMVQSYKKLEIIVIDDGSTDGSGKILDDIALQDRRIRLHHQENRGVGAARNRGLDLATGEFVIFVDGDDYISRNYISRFMKKENETGAQMIICGIDFVNEDGKVLKRLIPGEYKRFEREEWPMRISAVCSHFYRREIWEQHHIRFALGVRGEDMPVSLYFAAQCERICTLEKSGYAYLQRRTSARHTFRGLRKWTLPYEALETTIRSVSLQGCKNGPAWHEVFVMRILATCLFDLGKGADRAERRKLRRYIGHIVKIYFPNYKENQYLKLNCRCYFPMKQKAAVFVLCRLLGAGYFRTSGDDL